jgi:Zn-dependent M28 family amino/carboxypeptidase
LRGSDPRLAQEYVAVTAHLDHLGLGPARDGDAIYNGAFDNASGTAALLELAAAFASGPRRPRRSILFAAVTAEEKGLLGAEYFVHNPTVPLKDVVAALNMDMFVSLFPLRDVVAFGAEHSSLGETTEAMARRLGLERAPDPFPEQVVFIRSDHFAFVKKGIPALMLSSGLRSSDPSVDGPALFGRWITTVYHSPKDDLAQPIDFDEAARVARLYYLIARQVADGDARPAWKPGDFFGTRFGR